MLNEIITGYFILINIIGFITMGLDKHYAQKHKRRISEKALWRTAIIGGACGMTVAMNLFHHKTKHANFKWGFPLLAIGDLVLFYFILHI